MCLLLMNPSAVLARPHVSSASKPVSSASQSSAPVTPFAWNANDQGQFIISFCRDKRGNVWVGTEDQGVYRLDPAAAKAAQYTHFTTKEGLGDDNAYALTCDKAGRVWVGTLNHGVSVYNGKSWRTYGPLDGPLGSRVFALAVSPKDGGVWGATEAGLFRYQNSRWTYFTRANGLPSDQASALAFDSDGTLYVGTQCDGIAVASPADNYKSWRIVAGPQQMPNAAMGDGLPSALINCLLVSASGTVYAGTPLGLADSKDEGLTWHYRQGVDWKAKLAGLYHPLVPDEHPLAGDLLHDDYVTCLGEDGAGRLFIGHRQGGVEVFDPKLGKRVQSGANGGRLEDYIGALLVGEKAVWVGMYGGGLLPPAYPEAKSASSSPVPSAPPLPVSAAPPTAAQLSKLLSQVQVLEPPPVPGMGILLGQDWQTKGDWVGRYGCQYAVLCAATAPLDQALTWNSDYSVTGRSGPHHDGGDSLRYWVTWHGTDNSNTLYSPVEGKRIQAEWDDHGEAYPQTFGGPDVWITVSVPKGIYRLSMYDFNKDGHDGANRYRDYLVDLLPYRNTLEEASVLPPLAHGRIVNFWNGQYLQFQISGPSRYYMRIAKQGSFNTLCTGVFLDKLQGARTHSDQVPLPFMGGVRYDPPRLGTVSVPGDARATTILSSAQALWTALDANEGRGGGTDEPCRARLLALRAVAAVRGSETLQQAWRWRLGLWTDVDRQMFSQAMARAWQSQGGEHTASQAP